MEMQLAFNRSEWREGSKKRVKGQNRSSAHKSDRQHHLTSQSMSKVNIGPGLGQRNKEGVGFT